MKGMDLLLIMIKTDWNKKNLAVYKSAQSIWLNVYEAD